MRKEFQLPSLSPCTRHSAFPKIVKLLLRSCDRNIQPAPIRQKSTSASCVRAHARIQNANLFLSLEFIDRLNRYSRIAVANTRPQSIDLRPIRRNYSYVLCCVNSIEHQFVYVLGYCVDFCVVDSPSAASSGNFVLADTSKVLAVLLSTVKRCLCHPSSSGQFRLKMKLVPV